jgi:hypothetical protein
MDVVLQVGSDLRDPCISTHLSFWILRIGVHGVPRDAYDNWRAPWNQDGRDLQLWGAGLTPFTWFSKLGYRSLQFKLNDPVGHWSPRGGLCSELIGNYISGMRDVL